MQSLPSLADTLAQIPDTRQQAKIRHPLVPLLLHALWATLCGCRGPTAIAQWGRLHPERAVELGYDSAATPCAATPCAATFCRLFAALRWKALVQAMREWVEAWMSPEEAARLRSESPPSRIGIALDGKTHRGSRKRGGVNGHVLTAVVHEIGLTLDEASVDDKTNEIPVAKALLRRVRLSGRLVTMDALLTQREIAALLVEGGGDDVMPVQNNHQAVCREIHALFRCPEALEVAVSTAETVEKNHGRLEIRRLTAMSATSAWGDRDWAESFD